MNFANAGGERIADCGDGAFCDIFVQAFRTPELSSCSMLDFSGCFRRMKRRPRSLNVNSYLESRLGRPSAARW